MCSDSPQVPNARDGARIAACGREAVPTNKCISKKARPADTQFRYELVVFLITHVTRSPLPTRKVVLERSGELPGARFGNTVADEAHGRERLPVGSSCARVDKFYEEIHVRIFSPSYMGGEIGLTPLYWLLMLVTQRHSVYG